MTWGARASKSSPDEESPNRWGDSAISAPCCDSLEILMSLLFKNLRVHQVFGANTDVGKTILTSGLVRASAVKESKVFYLKPVSTGPMQDADDE
jgi:hypothetical protein